jgi:IS5 family transposase
MTGRTSSALRIAVIGHGLNSAVVWLLAENLAMDPTIATQLTLAAVGFERYAKPTRRAMFLAEMERVVPWSALCALIEPFYPKPGNGRPPVGVERTLRIYFLQQCFNRSDPAVEEGLYDSSAMRRLIGIALGREPVPDETTVCRFRHLLEDAGQFADSTVLPELLRGQETRVGGDQAYRGQRTGPKGSGLYQSPLQPPRCCG